MSKIKGTPKSLGEAMQNALDQAHAASTAGGSAVAWHIKDYISQKFTVAMYNAKSQGERDRLMDLFKKLTDSE